MKAAAIYARVSTEEQARNTSLDGQVEACQQFALAQGYAVIKEVREDSSGARLDRRGLTQIRDMAERGDIEAVIVYDPDRLSRSNAHTWMLMDEFDRRRVALLFVNVPREDTPEGRMLFGMRTLFAEYEREKIKERTRRGRERSARNGQVLSSAACSYGYTYIPTQVEEEQAADGTTSKKMKPARYDIKEVEARVVRQLFHWLVNERMTMGKIVERLRALGVPTKRGGKWSRSTLLGIFSNETYTGTFYWNRHQSVAPKNGRANRKTEKSSLKLKDRSEWIGVPVPAIVDREIFEAAGRQLRLNAERSKRNTKTPHLLQGMVICGTCGRKYYAVNRYDRHKRLYKCRSKTNDLHGYVECASKRVTADQFEEQIWTKLTDYLSDPKRIEKGIKGKDAVLAAERRREEEALESAVLALQTVEREEARLLAAYQQGAIELEQLQGAMSELKKRKEGLVAERNKIAERGQRRSKWIADLRAIEAVSEQARDGFHKMGFERRRAVLEVLEIQVHIYLNRFEITGLLTEKLTILLQEPSQPAKPVNADTIEFTNLKPCERNLPQYEPLHLPFTMTLELTPAAM